MAATPLPNPYDKMPLPRLRPQRATQSSMTIDGALAQPSPRPMLNVGPQSTDPLTRLAPTAPTENLQ